MNCTNLRNTLPELLLDQKPLTGEALAHIESCPPCGQEYSALQSTYALLDLWKAPEPSAFFDQKLAVRLREEALAEPAGWYERLRSRLLFNTGAQFRPMLAGAMAAVLLLGGGTFAGLSKQTSHRGSGQVSAAVGDLQIIDKNDQALQQMDQLLQDDPSPDDPAAPAPRS